MKFQIDSNAPVTIDIHRLSVGDLHNRHGHHHSHSGLHVPHIVEHPLPEIPFPPIHQPPEPPHNETHHKHNHHDEPTCHNCFMVVLEFIGEAAHAVIKGFFNI